MVYCKEFGRSVTKFGAFIFSVCDYVSLYNCDTIRKSFCNRNRQSVDEVG